MIQCPCGCILAADDRAHGGSGGGYTNWKCRCPRCRDAHRDSVRRRRAERRHETPPDRVHGTTGGYDNWWCRCVACTAVHNAAARRYRASKVAP